MNVLERRLGYNPEDWRHGRRVGDASGALPAYPARRGFGYSARAVATALGYRGHGGVAIAVTRIESAGPSIRRTPEQLALTTNVALVSSRANSTQNRKPNSPPVFVESSS